MNCVVCWESYNIENRKPYVLNCGNTFCFTCLQDINIILCPNCRTSIDNIITNYSLLNIIQDNTNKNTINTGDKQCVLFRKSISESYGFELKTKVNKTVHLIANVKLNSIAYKAGLNDNDFILKINGESIEKLDHKSVAKKMISDSLLKVTLGVVSKFKSTPSMIVLNRNSHLDEYGFDLMSKNTDVKHYIDKVAKDSKAFQAGLIDENLIIEVNGQKVDNLDHNIVANMILSIPTRVNLLISDIISI